MTTFYSGKFFPFDFHNNFLYHLSCHKKYGPNRLGSAVSAFIGYTQTSKQTDAPFRCAVHLVFIDVRVYAFYFSIHIEVKTE